MAVKRPSESEALPHLSKARIDVQEHTRPGRAEDLLVSQEPIDVQEQDGPLGSLHDFLTGEADERPSTIVTQGIRVLQTEALDEVQECLDGRPLASIQKEDVPTQLLETKHVLQ